MTPPQKAAEPSTDIFSAPAEKTPATPPSTPPVTPPAAPAANPTPPAEKGGGDLFGGSETPDTKAATPTTAQKPAEQPAAAEPKPAEKPAAAPAGDKSKPEEKKADEKDNLFGASPSVLNEAGGLASGEMRLWTDNTGNFSCRGRLVRFLDGHVRVLKENGRTTTVPLARLSARDLEFVNRQASAQQAETAKTAQTATTTPTLAN